MSKRICDNDGKERELKGGKTCRNGHFICRYCHTSSDLLGLFVDRRTKCPICGEKLR
ncbi:MAG TPA: hypothetical protein PLA11_16430 [Flavobacteriales bacterium]|nr:hypothetical protein [Flavobacteriales bacterium]MCB0810207.1 hypothetical protein [Flavobacteriales bacterium]MCB0815710.1 hypothetical protein [Flavobacteriales bacterium]HOP45111.1 hypothetical protein [Flavobacteriales bacterium]